MGWQLSPLCNRMLAFFHPWEFFAMFYVCFIFLVKVKSPLNPLNLGHSDILQNSILSCTHIIHLIVLNTSYELRSQTMYHVTLPGQFCHPCSTGLATALVSMVTLAHIFHRQRRLGNAAFSLLCFSTNTTTRTKVFIRNDCTDVELKSPVYSWFQAIPRAIVKACDLVMFLE